MSDRGERLARFEEALGHRFECRELLEEGLRHSSAAHQQGLGSNERLEFLGDAALSHATAAILFERWKDASEGELTRARAALVRERSLAEAARRIGLPDVLELGGGVAPSASLLADGLEAVLGGVLLDGGWRRFKVVVRHLLQPTLTSLRREELALEEPKSTLQELAQGENLPLPIYREIDVKGPPHGRIYVFEVEFGGVVIARGEGSSKRAAQQSAARHALKKLRHDS